MYFSVRKNLRKLEKSPKKLKFALDKSKCLWYNINVLLRTAIWELSSAGRASALQAGGHRFDPYSDHHLIYGLVVQLVRMPPCHGGGRRFEPVPGRHKNYLVKLDIFYIRLDSSVGRAGD